MYASYYGMDAAIFCLYAYGMEMEALIEAQSENYAKERQWNGVLWFLTLIMGKSTWLTTTTYGNIEIEYDNRKLYELFAQLIR